MTNSEVLYLIEATSPGGITIRTGPFDIGQAVLLVDEHLAPTGWAPRVLDITPIDRAMNVFTVARERYPVEGADVFVALRRHIRTDPRNDGADCPRAGAFIAHLESHRPVRMWRGDEECLLNECDHPRTRGFCTGLTPADLICTTCSPVYDPGGEWGPDWIQAGRVEWPCDPIRAAATHYQLDLNQHLGVTL